MHASFRIASLAAATSLALVALPASAVSDFFLKIDGVEGESLVRGHEKEIEVSSWSWGVSQSAATGNGARAAGKPCTTDVSFTKFVDRATPLLIAGAASGSSYASARLVARKSTGGDQPQDYLTIELKNVLVSSFQTTGSDGSAPLESFALRFGSMTVSYRPQKSDGSLGTPIVASIAGGC